MPNKKGSRVAASQARAKSAAKKKAHSVGPDLAAAAHATEPTPATTLEGVTGTSVVPASTTSATVEAALSPLPAPALRRTTSRRERQALTVMSAGSLRREVAMIGSITALAAVALAVTKLVTDLGR